MKPMMKEEESSSPNPEEILSQGKQLCMIGESLIATAKAMGAEDSMEEDSMEDESGDEAMSDDMEASEDESEPAQDPKKMAIILAIKKKLGKK